MDLDQGKLFIGGISWDTTEEQLKSYFSAYGEVVEAVIMKDKVTGRARGFGFVVFLDPAVADRVVQERHTIEGRMVEAKKAVPRDEQQNMARSNNGGVSPGNQARTKKIFVGGLASTVTETDFRKYFEQFGTITDVVVMFDQGTQRPRGFGFITFDSEDAVENVLQKTFHELNRKMVEVKRAIPKELSTAPTRSNGAGFGAGSGRGSPYGGYAQGFNSSPVGAYGARMDSRYGLSPVGRSGYPSYGAAGFGSSGGYGAAMNGGYGGGSPHGANVGYGASGSYGASGYSGAQGGSVYGGGTGGYDSASGIAGGGHRSTPVRNVWGTGGTGYGSGGSSTGGGTGMSGYIWDSIPNSGGSTGYGGSNYGYGRSSDGGYGSMAGNTGQSSVYGSSVGGYGSGGGNLRNYTGGYGEIYGNSGFSDPTWRSNRADSYNAGSGGYGISGIADMDSAANGSAAYAIAGRQSHRGGPG